MSTTAPGAGLRGEQKKEVELSWTWIDLKP